MAVYYVADVVDIPEGNRKIYDVNGHSIGVYCIQGEFFALLNRCPHQGAELCKSDACGTNVPSDVHQFMYGRHGEIARCPWHGWEFDIRTGKALFNEKVRARKYPVKVENGKIAIDI